MKPETRGRRAIFTGKRCVRLQGVITGPGSRRFEDARKRLGKAAGVAVAKVSDADTIEYLARVESLAPSARQAVLADVAAIVKERIRKEVK